MIIITDTDENADKIELDVNAKYLHSYKIVRNPTKQELYRYAENKCFIIYDESCCRGLDFKISNTQKSKSDYIPTQGIDLLITAELSNQRAFI